MRFKFVGLAPGHFSSGNILRWRNIQIEIADTAMPLAPNVDLFQ
jgi:hypothetical protein